MNFKSIRYIILIISFFFLMPVCFAQNKTFIEIKKQKSEKILENEQGYITKEITNINKDTGDIEITVTLNNSKENKNINSGSEIWLVLDNSLSMDYKTADGSIRKDLIVESTRNLVEKLFRENSNIKVGIIKFKGLIASNSDAKIITNLSSDKNTVLEGIETYENTSTESGTNIHAGIYLAQNNFSNDASKKIIILLTDGLPTSGIGISNGNDITTEKGLRIQEQLKNYLKQIDNEGTYIISMMTGLDPTDSNYETDLSAITNMFGTSANPTAGSFYNIKDTEINTVVENSIFNDITTKLQQPIKDITITDYFPSNTLEYFDFNFISINKGESTKQLNDNKLVLILDNLSGEDNLTLKYNLKAKDMNNINIVNKSINTNEKVVLTYKDINDEEHEVILDDSPSIKFSLNNTETVQNPKTDIKSPIYLCIPVIIGIYLYYKNKQLKKQKP